MLGEKERENPYNVSDNQGRAGGYVNVIMREGKGRGGEGWLQYCPIS